MQDFKKAYDAATFRQQGHDVVNLLADYLERVSHKNEPTLRYKTPDAALDFWSKDFEAELLENPTDLFQKVIENSMHLHSPRYVGHQVTAPLPVAALAAFVDSFLANSGAVHEMGMVVNSMEKIVTNWFSKHLGFNEDAYGFITSGGTLANLTALLTARANNVPEDIWQTGTKTRLAIMVSEQAHYCVDRAARIMGLGDAGIIKVPTDANLQMKTDLLEGFLVEAKLKGMQVFAVIGSACTTSTGSYDNLEAIADFCKKNQIWMHVDGAHGGVVALSERYKHLIKGIERADSVIVDFHKVLLVPSLTTGVFYRNPKDSYKTFAQKASYLFATQDEDWFNLGKRTFECTKPGLVLRIYTILRMYGESMFRDTVEYLYDLGAAFAKMIDENPKFELAIMPQTNIVCFRYLPDNQSNIDIENQKIREKIVADGRFYIVSTIVNGSFYLRVSIMNPLTTATELEELLEMIIGFEK
jgi:L-2,4-diaminobutyrate decarboxylase